MNGPSYKMIRLPVREDKYMSLDKELKNSAEKLGSKELGKLSGGVNPSTDPSSRVTRIHKVREQEQGKKKPTAWSSDEHPDNSDQL